MAKIQFCPKCGSVLILGEAARGRLQCTNEKCSYKTREKKNIIFKEKVQLGRENKIEIIDKQIETLPKVKANCSKCGHKKAYYWMIQTRASDEAETKFYECCKCQHRWREYN